MAAQSRAKEICRGRQLHVNGFPAIAVSTLGCLRNEAKALPKPARNGTITSRDALRIPTGYPPDTHRMPTGCLPEYLAISWLVSGWILALATTDLEFGGKRALDQGATYQQLTQLYGVIFP